MEVIEYRTLCGIMKTWPPPGNPRWHCFEERSGSTCKTLLSKGKKGERISAIRIIDLQSLIFCNFNDSSRICVIFRDRFFFTRARFKFIFAIHY